MYRAFSKRICTYKLHRFFNCLAAVCTGYILCASDRSPESVPAADSKSIKAFIQIIMLSVFQPFPLQERPQAGAGGAGGSASCACALASAAALDPAAEPEEHWKDFCAGRLLAPAVLTISTWSASANSLDDPSCSYGSVVVKDVLW